MLKLFKCGAAIIKWINQQNFLTRDEPLNNIDHQSSIQCRILSIKRDKGKLSLKYAKWVRLRDISGFDGSNLASKNCLNF